MTKKHTKLLLVILLFLLSSCQDDSTSSNSTDKTPPEVTIISHSDNAILSGEETIVCQASDNVGVEKVELVVNGSIAPINDEEAPYELIWDTRIMHNITYFVSAKCTDVNGNIAYSDTLALKIKNGSELVDIIFQSGSFIISWLKHKDSDFSSYRLFEASGPYMTNASLVYETSDLEQLTYSREGINLNARKYYQLITTDFESYQMKSGSLVGSSYPNIIFSSGRAISSINYHGDGFQILSYETNSLLFHDSSPSGEKIAFIPIGLKLYSIDKNGGNKIEIATHVDRFFSFSNDGEKIVFVNDLNNRIHTLNSDGTNLQKISNVYSGWEKNPVYSPNSEKIAFSYISDTGQEDIYIMDSNGSNRTQLTTNGNCTRPLFSPSRDQILYSEGYLHQKLSNVSFNGENITLLMDSGNEKLNYQFTPDGNLIIFESFDNDNGIGDIWRMDYTSTNLFNLTTSGNNHTPRVSPDGKKVLYIQHSNDESVIFIMDINGHNKINLTYSANWYDSISFLKQK